MSREIVQELTFFTHSVLMGLVITFVYDWIRVLRKLFRHGTALMSAEDLLFWLTCGIGVFYMLYRENDGTLRWFAVLGATVGMFFIKSLSGMRLYMLCQRVCTRSCGSFFASYKLC